MTGLVALVVVGAAGACDTNNPRYVAAPGPLEIGGMDPGGVARPGSATGEVVIPFRAPTAGEQAALDAEAANRGLAQPVPWIRRSQVAIEVLYTVTNLDSQDGVLGLELNGADEFTRYDPAAILAGLPPEEAEDADILPLHQAVPVQVPAGATLRGTIREDDVGEADLDLDAIGRFAATPAAVLINRSEVNPVGLEMVPANTVVPSLQTVLLTAKLLTPKASSAMHVEYLVRVRDRAGRLFNPGDTPFMPTPVSYTPPAAP